MEELHDSFIDSLERAMQIAEVNNRVIEVAQQSISSLGKIHTQLGANAGANQILALGRLKDSPQIKEILPIVYGQQIVLFVSAFEAYLRDIVRFVGSNYIGVLEWPEKSSGKIDLAELKRDSITIGDLVLAIVEQHGFNFQDLQSIKRFFKDYLRVDISLGSEYEQNIILAAAMRHVIVHAAGVANSKFLQQIRGLDRTVRNIFTDGQPLVIPETMVIEFRDSFINIADKIKDVVKTKIPTGA